MEANYRIRKADGRILNAGTDKGSWFTNEQAANTVDTSKGEVIICDDGFNEPEVMSGMFIENWRTKC